MTANCLLIQTSFFEGLEGHGTTAMVYMLESLEPNQPSWVFKVLKKEYIRDNFDLKGEQE